MKKHKIGIVFLTAIIIGCAVYIGSEVHQDRQSLKKNENLVQKQEEINWDELRRINPDVVGWIRNRNVGIDNPVVIGPDNSFYLNHNFYREYDDFGAIFMDAEINDFNRPYQNVYIYGHTSPMGGMFTNLNQYENYAYFKTNPSFDYFTEEKDYKLEIASVFIAPVDTSLAERDFADEKDYLNYLKQVKAASIYDTGVDLDTDDKIVTLYTCNFRNAWYSYFGVTTYYRMFVVCKVS